MTKGCILEVNSILIANWKHRDKSELFSNGWKEEGEVTQQLTVLAVQAYGAEFNSLE